MKGVFDLNCNDMQMTGIKIYRHGCSCHKMEREQEQYPDHEHGAEPHHDPNPCHMKVAMAYVPMQPWERTYDSEKGLRAGTIFPSLDLPFKGGDRR